MSADQFTYWLQGFFEISDSVVLSERQIQIIKDHLNLVFNKVTPVRLNNSKTLEEFLDQPICSGPIKKYFYNRPDEPLLDCNTTYLGSC